MNTVVIRSYPRIHLGLLELSGNYSRIDGGAGLTVSAAPMIVTVTANTSFRVTSNNADAERICHYVINDLSTILPSRQIHIAIKTESGLHLGLGFSTQCALTIGCAVLSYFRISFSKESLALSVRRGGTSGIGIHSFFDGGFIIDGGHSYPDGKRVLGPSSQSTPISIPPLIARHSFPNWKICIAIPYASNLLGNSSEANFWRQNTPIPEHESNYLCKNLLLGILPAIQEKNFAHFCAAMHNSTLYGLKKREITYWQPQYDKCKRLLEKYGWNGITLSSLGPALVGFSETQDDLSLQCKELENSFLFSKVYITTARNLGYDILSEKDYIC